MFFHYKICSKIIIYKFSASKTPFSFVFSTHKDIEFGYVILLKINNSYIIIR